MYFKYNQNFSFFVNTTSLSPEFLPPILPPPYCREEPEASCVTWSVQLRVVAKVACGWVLMGKMRISFQTSKCVRLLVIWNFYLHVYAVYFLELMYLELRYGSSAPAMQVMFHPCFYMLVHCGLFQVSCFFFLRLNWLSWAFLFIRTLCAFLGI